jgi:hypothetical protein
MRSLKVIDSISKFKIHPKDMMMLVLMKPKQTIGLHQKKALLFNRQRTLSKRKRKRKTFLMS